MIYGSDDYPFIRAYRRRVGCRGCRCWYLRYSHVTSATTRVTTPNSPGDQISNQRMQLHDQCVGHTIVRMQEAARPRHAKGRAMSRMRKRGEGGRMHKGRGAGLGGRHTGVGHWDELSGGVSKLSTQWTLT